MQNLGDHLPDFSLPVMGGGQRSLDGALDGKRGAVVVFWSSVCSHCRRYDDYLSGFAGHHRAARDRQLRLPRRVGLLPAAETLMTTPSPKPSPRGGEGTGACQS